jgi:hypothetical protein
MASTNPPSPLLDAELQTASSYPKLLLGEPPTPPPPPGHATGTVELVWYRVFRNGEAGQGEQLAAREATELGINMFVTPEM